MTATDPSAPPPFPPSVGGDEPRRPNGIGLAATITGAVALVLACIPYACFAAGLPALAAVVLGIVGLVLRNRRRLLAIIGLVLGAVAIVVAIVVSAVLVVTLVTSAGSAIRSLPRSTPSSPFDDGSSDDSATPGPSSSSSVPTIPAGRHTIEYVLGGSGKADSVGYSAYAGGRSGSDRESDVALPVTQKQEYTSEAGQVGSFTLTASQADPTEPLTCTIKVDGQTIARRTSGGGSFAFVACIGRTR